MNKHVSVRWSWERDDAKSALRERTLAHRWLLACMAVALSVGGPVVGWALNGEPVGAEGLHRTGACDVDFTISCDDRAQSGVVSCHMRDENDEGLAINACVDGRVTAGRVTTTGPTQGFLEKNVTVNATDFGEFVCGQDSDGSDFCIVCDTFVDDAGGASNCVKIVNDNASADGDAACGAFTVSRDSGLCPGAELDLQQFFSDPHLGFTIGFNGSDAGIPAGKDLSVCGSRSWQCIDVRPRPLVTEVQQIQEQQTHALIYTPCCIRLASGSYYCSAKLTPSATCR